MTPSQRTILEALAVHQQAHDALQALLRRQVELSRERLLSTDERSREIREESARLQTALKEAFESSEQALVALSTAIDALTAEDPGA